MSILCYQPNQSIVVTGSAGMLAHAFRSILTARRFPAEFVKRSEWDITDPPQVEAMFEDLHPTICINCAGYTKVDLAENHEPEANAVNGAAVGTLAELCEEYGTTLVHFSTDYVFDGTLRRALLENDPVGPQSAYGRSKLLGEQLLQSSGLDRWVIIRTAWLYGSGGPCFPQAILSAARAGKLLTVVNDQVGSPTFTHDLADATLRLIDAGARGIFHVTNTGETTWYDFAVAILDHFGIEAEVTPISSEEWQRQRKNSAIRPAYSVLDTSKYTSVTGHTLRHWREALREYRQLVTAGA